ncbi:GUN4 domain-containing protein [Anabaena lutea FACHB-196]|uniref:GUN4 domain-containing protein n=2 Tax=Anabaena TaxID=1163 RepID=A0ABR8FMD9_9NOST|nr:GUN4 domain-containing protein [Anabaena lutea FACHB-196]
MGKNPKLINELDTHNLEILEEEEQLKIFGIDTSDLSRRYKINNKDFDVFYQFLITVHALFAGLTIDIHYLIHYDETPLLPQLLSDLVVGDKQIIGGIFSNYQGVYQSLANERSALIPELFLDLAHSLSHLSDQSWAREQLNSSVRYWLSLRGVTKDSNTFLDLLEATRSFLTLQDKDYLEKLKQFLARLGDTEGVRKVASLLSETVELQKKADDFYNGGIYHLENGNYERSIADFEQAQSYRHPDASRMLVEVRKQQDMAVLAKQLEELERQRLEQEKRQQEQQAAEQAKLQAQKQQEVKPAASSLVSLKSAVGMDYRKLQDLLAAGKWKEADEETNRVMLAIAKREFWGFLDVESIDHFPCEDLRTIDQLWVKYSNGRFGFSVQKRIYQGLGGTLLTYNKQIWEKFGDKVGWRLFWSWLGYKDITFDKAAPEGHLPVAPVEAPGGTRLVSGWGVVFVRGGRFRGLSSLTLISRRNF